MCGMKLESVGILIALKPFNERDALGRIFTRDNGILVGMLRGAVVAKKNIPLIGQIGNVTWNARLDSQLGVFHWETEKNVGAKVLMNPNALMFMNAAFDLLNTLLPERESYVELYDNTLCLLERLANADTDAYLQWEICLLRELGYALDLSKCSGCGKCESLEYLSPRTGRAVCSTCAGPYLSKLYQLPLNINVTLRFLESVCLQQGTQIPLMRKLLK
jgi:DNA repair protein RecO (recombination protein O)